VSWNYRIIKHIDKDGDEYFAIHEVYYDEAGNPNGVTEDEVGIHGTNMEELKDDLKYHRNAFRKPVLNYEDF